MVEQFKWALSAFSQRQVLTRHSFKEMMRPFALEPGLDFISSNKINEAL